MSSNSNGFLHIDFSEIASDCGFEDLNFALNPELSEFFTSEHSDGQVLTISTNSAYELSTESCTGINIGDLSFTASKVNNSSESNACDEAIAGFQAIINGSNQLSLTFFNVSVGV